MPDGRRMVVTYYVDGYSGFVADVKYEDAYHKPEPKPYVAYHAEPKHVTYHAEPKSDYHHIEHTNYHPEPHHYDHKPDYVHSVEH